VTARDATDQWRRRRRAAQRRLRRLRDLSDQRLDAALRCLTAPRAAAIDWNRLQSEIHAALSAAHHPRTGL